MPASRATSRSSGGGAAVIAARYPSVRRGSARRAAHPRDPVHSMRASPPPPVTLQRPPALAPGARVALVAPAGPLRGVADTGCAEATVRRLGWEPVVAPHVLERHGYFAGPDAHRVADLAAALADPSIDAIWCLRGGYGVMRLLDALSWRALADRPRALIGFSDITALLAAAGTHAGLGAYHGPVARNPLTPFSERSLLAAVHCTGEPCGAWADARTLCGGRAEGRLAGGNLALLAALTGTPYFPDLRGAILVVEDVNEAAYRVDRMLRQLLLSGALAELQGIVVGQFTGCPEQADDDGARSIDDLFRELADTLQVPCAAGAPVGHVDDQWTLPLGAHARFDADAATLDVGNGTTP